MLARTSRGWSKRPARTGEERTKWRSASWNGSPGHPKAHPAMERSSDILTRVTRRPAEIRLDGLLRTACEVIAERGLANTRTADVAKAAGVSQALVFYHFSTKDRLLAQTFAWAAEQDLNRLDGLLTSRATPLVKLRRILKWYAATGSARSWGMWIECRAESLRAPDLEKVSRRLDLRWRDALTDVITTGVKDGDFVCEDPTGAAWRIVGLIDGLSVTATVHGRMLSRRQMSEWVRLTAGRELGLDQSLLN
jgi:AcrR family transcriptional regulator